MPRVSSFFAEQYTSEADIRDALNMLLTLDTDPALARMIVREKYETVYGVYNHDIRDRTNPFPLATIKKNGLEDWGLLNTYDRLLTLDAPVKTGTPIDELLDLDTHRFAVLVRSIERFNKRVNEATKTPPPNKK